MSTVCPRCARTFARPHSLKQHLGRRVPCVPAQDAEAERAAETAEPEPEDTGPSCTIEDAAEDAPPRCQRGAYTAHVGAGPQAAAGPHSEPDGEEHPFRWPRRAGVPEDTDNTLRGNSFDLLAEAYRRALYENPEYNKKAVLIHLAGTAEARAKRIAALHPGSNYEARWSIAPAAEAAILLCDGSVDVIHSYPATAEDFRALPSGAVEYLAKVHRL